MTAIVPPVREDGGTGEKGADGAAEGATTLTVAQRRWCIGAAVAVMGLASLGTALYQTNSSDVDPASADAIAPLETSQSGTPATPPAAGMQGVTALPPGYAGLSDPALGAMGAPGVGGLPPLSLLPAPAAGTGASPYAATPPARSQALADPPSALGSAATPPGASLPAAGATAPSTLGTSRSGAAAAAPGTAGAARSATPYRQTGTPGVIEVAPGQAPPPGYRRVYPGAPRAQAAPGTNGTSRQSGAYQQRTTPGATQPRYRSSPYGQASPNGTSTTPQRRTKPTSPSGTQTAPAQTAPTQTAPTQPAAPDLLGGLGG